MAPASLAPPPLPQHSLPTHYWAWGGGGGGRLALPRRGQGLRGPPGTKVPSWLPGWQEVGTAEGGEAGASCLPEKGVPVVPGLSCPLGLCPGFGTEPWREVGECAPCGPLVTLPHPGPLERGPWELAAGPVPTPLCRPVGSEVTGSHALLAHLFPRVPSFCSPHLGPSFLRQEEGREGPGRPPTPPHAPGGIWRQP